MIIFFDGICNLCNSSVQFIIRHDSREVFQFASLQSPYAQQTIPESIHLNTILLLKDGKIYSKSDAVLEICRDLDGFWKYGYYCKFFPKKIRDFMYDFIARHRYRLFGKNKSCELPKQSLGHRFLTSQDS